MALSPDFTSFYLTCFDYTSFLYMLKLIKINSFRRVNYEGAIKVLSVFLIVLIFTSLFGSEYVHAAPEIMDFWIDASSANAKSYTDGRLANDMIRWWRHHDNGRYYIMMPNSANLSKLKVL